MSSAQRFLRCQFFLHAAIVSARRCECVAVFLGVGGALARIRGIQLGLARLSLAAFAAGMCARSSHPLSAEGSLAPVPKLAHCTGISDSGPASSRQAFVS